MKVTALISDVLIQDVKKLSSGKNITESLTIALQEWVALKNTENLNKALEKSPLTFKKSFSAAKVRQVNRSV